VKPSRKQTPVKIIWIPADLSDDWVLATVVTADGKPITLPPGSSCHPSGVRVLVVPRGEMAVSCLCVAGEIVARLGSNCRVRFRTGVEAVIPVLCEKQIQEYVRRTGRAAREERRDG
jgi:hypothetical protein